MAITCKSTIGNTMNRKNKIETVNNRKVVDVGRFALATILLGLFANSPTYAGIEAKCKACHDFGTTHKVGPALKGIMGKKAGSTDFSRYSKSFKKGGWTWTEENMRKWLYDGKAAIKELSGDPDAITTMPPQKLKGDKLDQVIEYLKGLK